MASCLRKKTDVTRLDHSDGAVHTQLIQNATSPPADRAEALPSTVSHACSTSMADRADATEFEAERRIFEFGPAKVFNIDGSDTTVRRTPGTVRAMNEQEIALALPMQDSSVLRVLEHHPYGPRDLIFVDLHRRYGCSWPDGGVSYAFHVDVDELALPMDTVRTAARRLRSSPLYPLVRDHISYVVTKAAVLSDSAAAAALGASSVQLVRALILSAADNTGLLSDGLHVSTTTRVQAYLRNHLRDPDLSPAQIATANAISTRTLYKIYEALGTSLEQSIMGQRLQGARADLVAPGRRHQSIAVIARSWGFRNASSFSQRFRHAFGITPRQCRAGTPRKHARRSGVRPAVR